MYYSKNYIKKQVRIFEQIGGSVFYTKDYLKRFLRLEGKMAIDVSDKFFEGQLDRFPFGIIRNFLQVFPKLERKTRYSIEKDFLLRELDAEGYLTAPLENEIDLFYEYYEDGFEIGGETALADIKSSFSKGNTVMQGIGKDMGISFTLTDPVVRSRLKWEAGRRIAGINDTTRKLIINALILGYDNGEGYDGMKNEVKKLFAKWKVPPSGQTFTNKRAEMIARTELGEAVSWSRNLSYEKRDVRRKSWLSEPNACEVCVLASNDGVISFNSSFSNGFYSPLAHPNCRCALLPEVELQDYLQGYTWHGEAENEPHTQS